VNGSEISRVDIATGQKSIVAGSGPRPGSIGDIAFDARFGRVIALDIFPPRVIAIDAATGARTEVSSATLGGGPIAKQPHGIHVDASRQVAYVTDNLYDAVIAVDLLSGYRQVVSR
jgi:hypothetical protein